MRIAAIDIGTNSIHMIVVQIRPDLLTGLGLVVMAMLVGSGAVN